MAKSAFPLAGGRRLFAAHALQFLSSRLHSQRMTGPNETTDENLMLYYGKGDAAAFEQLYLRHKGPLYRYLLRSCANRADAEELFQEIWASIIKARSDYNPSAKFSTWLYRIATNRLTDHYRKHGKWHQYMQEADADEDSVSDCAVSAVHEQPEHKADINRQIERLLHCLEQLPALQRQVFLLREEAGMKIEEIAESIDSGKEAVKSRMRYAISRLRLCMGDEL
ncbi:MAG: RNA polymerase subunit sigma-24 [Zetaproteobacteria bacterium CG_4_9_14_3_um_filter_49_83]|nr:MAG: RNA polymerase subunit sigma-24 [Zetaproteobacteria bacterium CG17_big_fil_post_rev_8_21_14_2_50_50_13]PIV29027.1 MAG: RNA polymerase subunit sigma-24 [Zetaproteobacteria bacterium CG02_land_8_20_14_3_00_50_9]PIY57054.1 MAG: RNA polymerase subunit sigma-24 [Zetaproteobacteria bacterium CG_4_10_14_0_8_um_filter_49_80]PJA34406.1 MAG: RNA polymerase subunit sigma-24 [Zetaproteobacteria bacterium CG_4_9_14_3_um_filter_49_83]